MAEFASLIWLLRRKQRCRCVSSQPISNLIIQNTQTHTHTGWMTKRFLNYNKTMINANTFRLCRINVSDMCEYFGLMAFLSPDFSCLKFIDVIYRIRLVEHFLRISWIIFETQSRLLCLAHTYRRCVDNTCGFDICCFCFHIRSVSTQPNFKWATWKCATGKLCVIFFLIWLDGILSSIWNCAFILNGFILIADRNAFRIIIIVIANVTHRFYGIILSNNQKYYIIFSGAFVKTTTSNDSDWHMIRIHRFMKFNYADLIGKHPLPRTYLIGFSVRRNSTVNWSMFAMREARALVTTSGHEIGLWF